MEELSLKSLREEVAEAIVLMIETGEYLKLDTSSDHIGKELSAMAVRLIHCLAIDKDGK